MPHDLIKQKIQELVPEIMELKFGCEVQLEMDGSVHTVLAVFESEGYIKVAYRISGSNFSVGTFDGYISSFYKILGREITLADVLRAMRDRDEVKVLIWEEIDSLIREWNLSTHLDGQSDECKELIGQLLGVTQ